MDRAARGAFCQRLEGGDLLVFLYVAVIARQYLCWLPISNAAAWPLSAATASIVIWRYVITKSEPRAQASAAFWLIVGLPLTFVYLLRVPFPDVSFDVLNYRLFHGIRGLNGFLYQPGDFFPTPAPYNTAPDMAMGIARILFGYRLGTLINLFTLLWAARIIERLLWSHIANKWIRAAAVLAVLTAEHLLFEINTYMIFWLCRCCSKRRVSLCAICPASKRRRVSLESPSCSA
jgi:hypothetical protein